MKKVALLSLFAILPILAQTQPEPKFDAADVHVSPTARGFAQNFGGVLREGRYVNRDATMLNLITSAYGVADDGVTGPGWISNDLFDVIAKVPDGTKWKRPTSCCAICLRTASSWLCTAVPVPRPGTSSLSRRADPS